MADFRSVAGSEKGFTLVEVLVVIAILLTAVAIATPSIMSYAQRYKFRGAALEVMTALMQARSFAARDNQTSRVDFNSAANTFSVTVDYPLPVPDKVIFHDLSGFGNGIRLVGTLENSCGNANRNWNNAPINPGDTTSFTGRGTSNNASFYLENGINDDCYAVSTSINGVIRLRRYSQNSWD